MTSLLRSVLLAFFDSNLICEQADSKGCIDLLGITSGHTDNDGGLIKQLGKGVFMPFITLAFLSTAIYMLYTGLYKHEYRSSLSGFLWALFSFVLGIVTIVRPTLIARAPYKATQTISMCLLNILAGGDCSDGTPMEQLDDQSCTSFTRGPATNSEKTQLALNTIGCRITKGFTVDRWAKQQFGYHFDDLYTMGPVPSGSVLYPSSKLQGSPEDYCVNMYSTRSPFEFKQAYFAGHEMSTSSEVQVCNIAAAYMAATTSGDYGAPNMEKIIATAAKDEVMWNAFTGNGRDLLGFSQLIGILCVIIAFIPLTLTGLSYEILSTILMIFAPIFLLFSIHPGRGRKIFLGWLETVLGFILKYFATGILTIIALFMFQAVFKTSKGLMTLIMPLILATTFGMYRKEIINLIGAVSLGGSKLSNQIGDKLGSLYQSTSDKTKNLTKSAIGGYVGGHIAARAMDGMFEGETDEERAERYKEARNKGVQTSIGNELRRGNNFVANAARAGYQTKKAIEREVDRKNTTLKQDFAREQLLNANQQLGRSIQESTIQQQLSNNTENVKAVADNLMSELINSSLKDAMQRSVSKVESSKTVENSRENTHQARLEIKEIKTFNQVLKKHSSSRGSQATSEYIHSQVKQAESLISDQSISLLHELKTKGLTEDKARNKAELFMEESLKQVKTLKDQLDHTIEVADAGRGRTVVKTFNAEAIVTIKTHHNKNIQDLFNQSLEIE